MKIYIFWGEISNLRRFEEIWGGGGNPEYDNHKTIEILCCESKNVKTN